MKKIKVTDPRTGVGYSSMREMCNAVGINNPKLFYTRRHLGWSLEECLYGRKKRENKHEIK